MGIQKRKESEKSIRRNDIIDSAERVFFERGYEASTMDDVAKEAEFTKKTVYSYFNSKEELYYEIMLRGLRILNQQCFEAVEKNSGLKEADKIQLIGDTYIAFSNQYPGYFRFIINYQNNETDFKASNGMPLIETCYKEGEKTPELIRNCLANGIKKGEFTDKMDPVTMYFILWANMNGLITLALRKKKYILYYYERDAQDILRQGFRFILDSIKRTSD